MLEGRKILIGITGSIAAYKMAAFTRLLIKDGAEVRIIMTKAATDFISPLTMSTLSQNEVLRDMSTADNWNNHVELGLWADLMLIAPATANTLAKCRMGLADNLLLATYLSAKCPVFFAPAMDLDMWKHPSTKDNIRALQEYGHDIIDVGEGFLASGLEGEGRLAEPEDMLISVREFFTSSADHPLKDKKVLITAGPTYEAIDPVRFIGNRSSGKMGIALAEVALNYGAEVHLVMGPSSQSIPEHKQLHSYHIQSAKEMLEQSEKLFPDMSGAIFAAAVADYRPDKVSDQKVKKKKEEWSLQMVKNPDIAHTLGKVKKNGQWTVGFALETDKGLEQAKEKLKKKNFDLIVLNSLQDKGAGFEKDTNKVTLIDRKGEIDEYPVKSKTAVAQDILDAVVSKLL
jgi:phosphopantothenoylcysteine decarboxylase/phosphopantothenate--cysteine ligase